jgi:methylphosphotriester-DNA--protein-cysteine methyltransferase
MATKAITKAQKIHDRVEVVVAQQGVSKKEAHAIVASEFGMQPSSVRGAVFQHRKAVGLTGRKRVRETTTDGAVASAVQTLEDAREAIDEEVEAAKERADEANREHKELRECASARKAEITAKIEALTA